MNRHDFRTAVERHRAEHQARLDAEKAEHVRNAEKAAEGVLAAWIEGQATDNDAKSLAIALTTLPPEHPVARRVRDVADVLRVETSLLSQIEHAEERKRERGEVMAQIEKLEREGIEPAQKLRNQLTVLGAGPQPEPLRHKLQRHHAAHPELFTDAAGDVARRVAEAKATAEKMIHRLAQGEVIGADDFGEAVGELRQLGRHADAEKLEADRRLADHASQVAQTAATLANAERAYREARQLHADDDEVVRLGRRCDQARVARDDLRRLREQRPDLFAPQPEAESTPSPESKPPPRRRRRATAT